MLLKFGKVNFCLKPLHKGKIMPKNLTFEQIVELVIRLEVEVKKLRAENIVLKERLAKYENPKNSRNSSIPPSKDENRPKRKSPGSI